MSKTPKRKFYPAEDFGSGFLRVMSWNHGLQKGPLVDDPTQKKFLDPDLKGYHLNSSAYWILVEPTHEDFAVLSAESIMFVNSKIIVPVNYTLFTKILSEGLGTMSAPQTIQYPDFNRVVDHKDKNGRDIYRNVDSAMITQKCHVISGVKTQVGNRSGNYRLIVA